MHEKLKVFLDDTVTNERTDIKDDQSLDTTLVQKDSMIQEDAKASTFAGSVKTLVTSLVTDVEKVKASHDLTTFAGYSMAYSDLKERLDLLVQFQKDFAQTISKREGIYLLARKELSDFSEKSVEQAVSEIIYEESKGFDDSMTQEEKIEAIMKLQKVLDLEVAALRKALKVYTRKDTRMAHSIDKYITSLKKDLAKVVKKRDDIYKKYNERIVNCETTTDLYDVIIEIKSHYESGDALSGVQKVAFEKALALRDGISKIKSTRQPKPIAEAVGATSCTDAEKDMPMSRVARRRGKTSSTTETVEFSPTTQPLLILPPTNPVMSQKENTPNSDTSDDFIVKLPPLPIQAAVESVAGTLIEVPKHAYYIEKLKLKLPLLLEASLVSDSDYVQVSLKHEGYLIIRYEDYRIKFAKNNFADYYIYKNGENLIAKDTIVLDLDDERTVDKIQTLLEVLPTIWGLL